MPVGGLEDPCATCGRTSGDHTMREWAACMEKTDTDEFGARDEEAGEAIRRKFGIAPETLIADHVLIEAAQLDGHAGQVGVKVPAIRHTFAIGGIDGATSVAQVLYLAEPVGMRNYGAMVQKAASTAVRAAAESNAGK